jgi:hypothetical protein
VLGELLDAQNLLHEGHSDGPAAAHQAIKEFEQVKILKDA